MKTFTFKIKIEAEDFEGAYDALDELIEETLEREHTVASIISEVNPEEE